MAKPCCELDTDDDGNCPRHPGLQKPKVSWATLDAEVAMWKYIQQVIYKECDRLSLEHNRALDIATDIGKHLDAAVSALIRFRDPLHSEE